MFHGKDQPGYKIDLREYEYNKIDFKEIDGMFQQILGGELKAPAELVVRLYEERKALRKEIRSFQDFYNCSDT